MCVVYCVWVRMMDIEEVDSGSVGEDPEPFKEPVVGAIWKHRILLWTVVIDRISLHYIIFHTKDTEDPEFMFIKRGRANFLEEFSYSSTTVVVQIKPFY